MAANVCCDMSLTGAQIVIKKLLEHRVSVVFEFPGGTICSILDELRKAKRIKTFICRHEQAVAHAADAYARITKQPAVCLATSGPGASNLVTGIANAFMDSVPMVVITGQVAAWDLKGDKLVRQRGFQELDIVSVVKTITKYAFLVDKISNLSAVIDKAFFIAKSGRPGPVLIDIPINLQYIQSNSRAKCRKYNLSQRRAVPSLSKTKEIAKRLASSKRPLIIAGGGVILSSASEQLRAFIRKYKLATLETLMGLTAVESDYKLNLGLVGYAGSRLAAKALKKSDFILGLGLRFDNRAFPGANKEFSDSAYIVHVDCDRHELNHRVSVRQAVLSDVKIFLEKLSSQLKKLDYEPKHKWLEQINSWRLKARPPVEEKLTPEFILRRLSELAKTKKAIVTTDVGQHQLWTAQHFNFNRPNSLITSGGLGTMGFGLPAALGVQLTDPKALVFNITSDGSFQMNIQELATMKDYKLPVKIIILNNKCLGLVRQIQEFAFSKRYESTMVNADIDFVKISRAYGIEAFSVRKSQQVEQALRKLVNSKKSLVVDFRINVFENVYPVRIKGKIIDRNAKH